MPETALPAAPTVELLREGTAERHVLRVEHLTAEAGWMLTTAGVVVPGIAGTPFLVAGILSSSRAGRSCCRAGPGAACPGSSASE
jgi:hypothetical protein